MFVYQTEVRGLNLTSTMNSWCSLRQDTPSQPQFPSCNIGIIMLTYHRVIIRITACKALCILESIQQTLSIIIIIIHGLILITHMSSFWSLIPQHRTRATSTRKPTEQQRSYQSSGIHLPSRCGGVHHLISKQKIPKEMQTPLVWGGGLPLPPKNY